MASDRSRCDLAVIGLGAFGSAVAHHAAALGLQTIGLDRHHPPHEFGSSHAETRVTRLAVGEGDQYVPFARRSHELWRELEAATGETLLHTPGGLIIAPAGASTDNRWGDFVSSTAAVATRTGLAFERLDPATARRRFPSLRIGDDDTVGFEPSGGLVMAEMAVGAQLHEARRHGADLRTGVTVRGIERGDRTGSVRLVTDAGPVHAEQVIVCAGPWTPGLADTDRLRVTRQAVFWFEADLDRWRADEFAFAIWAGATIDDYVGVFAVTDNAPSRAVKVLGEQFVDATTPDAVDRAISDDEVARFHETMVAPRLIGVSDRCVQRAVCLYTNTTDDHFLVDQHPDHSDVTVVSACSGHGFKHSAAMGEALARRAAGVSHLDLSPFLRRHRARW